MQISMFDGAKPFKITKPIRLITLFSGYDSQALSLKYLGIPFEHYKTSEWAIRVEEIKCEQVATLQGGKWDKMHDIAKRVYGTNGISPTLHTCGGAI